MLCRLYQLVHEDVYERLLEACAYVCLVLLHEFRINCHLVTDKIEKRGLYATETVVKSRNMRLCELVLQWIPLLCKTVHNRSARISEAHHL